MKKAFPISLVRCNSDGLAGELAANVDGQEVFFRYNKLPAPLKPSGDPFLVAGIVAAMERNSAVEVEAGLPVCQVLIRGLRSYQEYYSQWFQDLSPVHVHAVDTGEPSTGRGVGCFFSGGIDSYFSFARNSDRVTHLILVRGLDIPFAEAKRWERTVEAVNRLAAAHGKTVLLVETNVKQALERSAHDNHGAILISTALAAGFRELIVPASNAYSDVFPWGSSPITDALLSNESTRIFHDGAFPRVQKVVAIVASGIDLSGLRVCNRHAEYNCGHCEKCLRTLVALEVLGATSSALPGPLDLRLLQAVKLWDEHKPRLWIHNRDLALARGRPDVAAACAGVAKRYARRLRLRRLDQKLLGGLIGRLRAPRTQK